MHVDGSTSTRGGGVGLILESPDGQTFRHALCFGFKATNNDVEYEALLSGLKLALKLQVEGIRVFIDSQLVVSHINGDYMVRDPTMMKYMSEAKKLVSHFPGFAITRVPWAQNEQVNTLTRLALGQDAELSPEVERLPHRTITTEEVATTDVTLTWVEKILHYKKDGTLPVNRMASNNYDACKRGIMR